MTIYSQSMEKKKKTVSVYRLTKTDVLRLAFDVAEKMGVQHRLNRETRLAGRDRLEGFMKRFPDLGLRQTARNDRVSHVAWP